MNSSLLYHGFGVKGQDVLKSEYKGGSIIVHIQTKEHLLRCGKCGSTQVIKKGTIIPNRPHRIEASISVGKSTAIRM